MGGEAGEITARAGSQQGRHTYRAN